MAAVDIEGAIDLGYQCREQFEPFHRRKQRWACLVAHRRAGKTVACIAELVDAALACDKPDGRFAYVAPYYIQAKDVAWSYLKAFVAPFGEEVDPNESELRVDLPNGSRIRLYGADNYDRMRGIYLDGVILDEYADMPPAAWGQVIRPALADREGWAVFIGTPKGRNAFWEIWEKAQGEPTWFTLMLRASETGLLPARELEDMQASMTPEQLAQELECSFDAAIVGSYFGKELADADAQGRICDLAPDPALPVHTAWDLGIGDSMAIWFFQVAGGEIRVIDHYENHGQGLGHYAAELEARGYSYGKDYVPHDARARILDETGRTRIQVFAALGRKPIVVPGQKREDGINAVRLTLPRVWFDKTKCAKGIEALRQYRTDYDEKAKVFKNEPKHDWTSHSADAFRYLCMAWREMAQPKEPEPPKPIDKPLLAMTTVDQFLALRPNQRRPTRV